MEENSKLEKLKEFLKKGICSVEKCLDDMLTDIGGDMKVINVTGLSRKEREELRNRHNCLVVQEYCYKEILKYIDDIEKEKSINKEKCIKRLTSFKNLNANNEDACCVEIKHFKSMQNDIDQVLNKLEKNEIMIDLLAEKLAFYKGVNCIEDVKKYKADIIKYYTKRVEDEIWKRKKDI